MPPTPKPTPSPKPKLRPTPKPKPTPPIRPPAVVIDSVEYPVVIAPEITLIPAVIRQQRDAIRISVDGTTYPDLNSRIVELEISESLNGAHRASIVLDNRAPGYNRDPNFDLSLLKFGSKTRIWSDTTESNLLIEGKVTGVEGEFKMGKPSTLRMKLENDLFTMRLRRSNRTFSEASDADIFSRIATENGFTPSIEVSGPTHKIVTQSNVDDLTFLQNRCYEIGAEFWWDNGLLHVFGRRERSREQVDLVFGSVLRSFSYSADIDTQSSVVSTIGWDKDQKRRIKESVDISAALGTNNQIHLCGPAALTRYWGECEFVDNATPVGTDEEAEQRASAIMQSRVCGFVKGRGTASGVLNLRAGKTVNLSNVGTLVDGLHTVTEVRHHFDLVAGWSTEFSTERPNLGGS